MNFNDYIIFVYKDTNKKLYVAHEFSRTPAVFFPFFFLFDRALKQIYIHIHMYTIVYTSV